MRYILSIIGGVFVSMGLFLVMTYMIDQPNTVPPQPPSIPVAYQDAQVKPEIIDPVVQEIPRPVVQPTFVKPVISPPTYTPTTSVAQPTVINMVTGLSGSSFPAPILPIDATQINMPAIELESKILPRYPNGLLNRGIEGHVIVENTVDENGQVVNVRIVESSHTGFEPAVRRSAIRWQYSKSDVVQRKHKERVAFVIND